MMPGPFSADDDLEAATDSLGRLDYEELDLAANPIPGAFDGTGDQLKSLMRPSASAGRSLMMLGAVPRIAVDSALSAISGKRVDAMQAGYFKTVDQFGTSAVDYWTPDAQTSGSAAKTVGMLGQVVGSIPQMIGAAPVFLANAGVDPATELVRQGVDANTALGVGGANLAANAAGMRIPAAFGSTLATRVATGAASNTAIGLGTDAVSASILDANGYAAQAEGYDPTDPYARGLDLLMGAAFGAKANIDAPRTPLPDRDAVLAVKNADHLARQTMPGATRIPAAETAHADAMATTIQQIIDGVPVNIADKIDPAQFQLAPPPARIGAGVTFDSAVTDVLKAEAGYVNDPVDRGGETKFGISRRSYPDTDIANLTQDQAVSIYRRDYWDAIKADSLSENMRASAFDAAVNQGVPWTRSALKEAGGDPVKFQALRRERYRAIAAADPTQQRFSRGWENRVKRFDAPAARQPFADPDAVALETFAATARQFDLPEDAVRILAPQAARDDVTGFYDGRASGVKTDLLTRAMDHVAQTGEPAHYVAADIFNLGGLNAAVGNRAEAANVHYREMAQALDRELRTVGAEIVPVRTGGDEFGVLVVNADAATVDAAIARAQVNVEGYALGKGLADIPNPKRPGESGVGLHIGRAEIAPGESVRSILDRADDGIDSSKNRNQANAGLQTTGQAGADAPAGRPAGAAAGAGPKDAAVRRPGGGEPTAKADGRGDSAAALDDAKALIAERPDAQTLTGYDDDGKPIYKSVAEVLESIEAARAVATKDAQAFEAAASCFLRRGAA